MDSTDRYHRQTLLPQIGPAGRDRLAGASVLLVGCGALGGTIAEQLVRAGVGRLRIVDRDIVELTNLQRQVLFDEADADAATPKAIAAAQRLKQINSAVIVEGLVHDVHAANIERLAGLDVQGVSVNLIIDGTDNAETRYLINDVVVKHNVPWIYGGCVGTEGRVMTIRPGKSPCLQCLFPHAPRAGELPTCDTAGVLGPAASVVASLQAIEAIKTLTGAETSTSMLVADLWNGSFRRTFVDATADPTCACCGLRQYRFLDRSSMQSTTKLCGRDSIQVLPMMETNLDLSILAARLAPVGAIERTPYLLRCRLSSCTPLRMTIFVDGRAIIQGTSDAARARSLYARYVGN